MDKIIFMAIWIKQLLWRYGYNNFNGDMDKIIFMVIGIKQLLWRYG